MNLPYFDFDKYIRALSRENFWGPFLVIAGLFVFYFSSLKVETEPKLADYFILVAGIFLTIAGVVLMFKQMTSSSRVIDADGPLERSGDAEYVVRQLSRNYEILRAQTNQGFLLSGGFMAAGLMVIIGSIFASSFGLKTEGVNNLGVIAGIVTEFISATALLLYRLNFKRLNETSDKLEDAWRVLAAYRLTCELPDDKKAEATLQLIKALTQERTHSSIEPEPVVSSK